MDIYCEDEKLGKESWEKAESEMCRMALGTALAKGKWHEEDIDLILAGDLMNQCTGAGYGLEPYDIPYLGLYGACSTFAEALMLGGVLIDGGYARRVAVVVSSHYCTAERQYRYPLEYGAFREPTAQTTVTGAACVILTADSAPVRLVEAMPGIVCDRGIDNAANMGAAMCTAAADTLLRYFESTGADPSAFDRILTGDLGAEGKRMARELMQVKGLTLGSVYDDCGTMIYDLEKQPVSCGGSGCGCSGLVTAGYLAHELKDGGFRDVLLVGTGAMMSPQSVQQGGSIPSVAHLVRLRRED